MKKCFAFIVMLLLVTILTAQAEEDETACNIGIAVPLTDPAQLEIGVAHNFLNEDSVDIGIATKQPWKIPLRLNLGGGVMWQRINYEYWSAQSLQEGEGEEFLGYYLNLEAFSSWKWFHFLIQDEVKMKHNLDFSSNRFATQSGLRRKPIVIEAAYSTSDLGRLRDLRYDGVYNQAVIRVGLIPHKVVEVGVQLPWLHYHNQNYRGTYRPRAGLYLRLLKKSSFVEISWARVMHKEKNLQTGRINFDRDKNRILVKMSYVPSQKLERRCY